MGQLLFILIITTVSIWALRFIGYESGIIVPLMALGVIIVAILRFIGIQRKNNY